MRVMAMASAGLLTACSPSTGAGGGESSSGMVEADTAVSTGPDLADSSGAGPAPISCGTEHTGELYWQARVTTTVDQGGGIDLASAGDGVVYVLDGCLSRWIEPGEFSWALSDPTRDCRALALDGAGLPVVAGSELTPTVGVGALVVAYDERGQERWKTLTHVEGEATRVASDVVVDPIDRVVVVGRSEPVDSTTAPWAWITSMDAEGVEQWSHPFSPGVVGLPRLARGHDGLLIVAEPRLNPLGISMVRLTAFDDLGEQQWSRNTLDLTGHAMELVDFAVGPAGSIAVAGIDSAELGNPALLSLIEPNGDVRWVRSGLDVTWLETVSTVTFTPCGDLLLGGSGRPDAQPWGLLWVARLTQAADLRWAHFEVTTFEMPDNAIAALHALDDGSVLAAGYWLVPDVFDEQTPTPESWLGRLAP